MAKTKTEKIESITTEIQQLENQRKKLIQQEKEQERKDRTRRLCKRAGLLESLLPDTIPLTDEQFKTFLEKTLLTDFTRRTLGNITTQAAATAAPQSAGSAAQGNTVPAAKPAHTAQERRADEGQDGGNGARATG